MYVSPAEAVRPTRPHPTDDTAPGRRAAPATGWSALLRRLHFYAGVLVAPWLVVAALTGLAYALTPQLDQLLYGRELTVAPGPGGPRPLAAQIEAAQRAVPGGTLASVTAGGGPGETTRVAFAVPALAADDLQRTVFVDPYRAEVRGVLTTSFGATPVTGWLSELHKNLHLGDVGRYYSELAASWLWVLVLGGLSLWWQRRYGPRGPRRLLLPDRRARGVRRTRGWHATTGVWLALVLLGLSATGLTWSRHAGARFDSVQEWVGASRPAVATAPAGAATGGGHGDHGGGPAAHRAAPGEADTVLAAGRRAGLTGPVLLTPPATPGHAWVYAQADNVWPVRYDALAVDGATGGVTDRVRWREWPTFAQLSKLGIQGHMGQLFGVANQILLVLVAGGLVAAVCWGYRMWWQRRPAPDPGLWRWGRAPRRGAWRGVHPAALLAAAVAVGAVGWALPVLGVSLLGFLAVDLIRGWRRGQSSDSPPPMSPMSSGQPLRSGPDTRG